MLNLAALRNSRPQALPDPQPDTVCKFISHMGRVNECIIIYCSGEADKAWILTPRALATLNGFNSRQLHRITGRSYREEATTPSYDLLTAVRTRRHQWLGHILRMPANRLVRRAVLALGQRAGPPYQPGSILMDAPFPLDELVLRAADRRGWARDTRSLSSLQESP